MNELQLQRELVKATVDAGGWGLKLSHRFLKGVADLYLMLPTYRPIWLEVKLVKYVPATRNHIDVTLTAHQSRFINAINRHGGTAGWLICLGAERDAYRMVIGCRPVESIATHGGFLHKDRGQPWPIREIVAGICAGEV